jgi:hypothetical protein
MVTPPVAEANPQAYLEWLDRQREANDLRAAGIETARATPDFSLPVSGLTRAEELPGEYRLPQPPPGEAAPEEFVGPRFFGAEGVAQQAADEADTDRIPIRQPGDVAREQARSRLAKLEGFRGIAEGLGTRLPSKGEITQGVMPEPFRAEGIRRAIGREDVRLGDLAAEDKLRLQSKLRLGGEKELQTADIEGRRGLEEMRQTGAGKRLTRTIAQKQREFEQRYGGAAGGKLSIEQHKELVAERKRYLSSDAYKKPREKLAAIKDIRTQLKDKDITSIEHVGATRSLLKALGEASRMSDQDINKMLFRAGFQGLYDRFYQIIGKGMTPELKRIYLKMTQGLQEEAERRLSEDARTEATSFAVSTGIPLQQVMTSFGYPEGAEEWGRFINPESGKPEEVHPDDVENARLEGREELPPKGEL